MLRLALLAVAFVGLLGLAITTTDPLSVNFTLFGLCMGSFLNVVIYRLPVMLDRAWVRDLRDTLPEQHQHSFYGWFADVIPDSVKRLGLEDRFNLAWPNSRCPHCGHAIRLWENIPVLSYLGLRGRCSGCQAPINLRYPLVELVTGFLTWASLWCYGLTWQGAGLAVFCWAAVALAMIDWDTMTLPDLITLPLMWGGLLLALCHTPFVSLDSAVLGAAIGYLSLWLLYWGFKLATGREGMGYGDFKLLAAIGAFVGWQALPYVILISAISGTLIGVFQIMCARAEAEPPVFPFGPHLLLGGLTVLFYGPEKVTFLTPWV